MLSLLSWANNKINTFGPYLETLTIPLDSTMGDGSFFGKISHNAMHRFGVQEAPRTISKAHEGHMVKAQPEGAAQSKGRITP